MYVARLAWGMVELVSEFLLSALLLDLVPAVVELRDWVDN